MFIKIIQAHMHAKVTFTKLWMPNALSRDLEWWQWSRYESSVN